MRRRYLYGLVLALVLAVGTPTAVTVATGYSPLCAGLNPGDAVWWILGCFVNQPPPDPRV